MGLRASRPHNPTLKQVYQVLHKIDLSRAVADIGLPISLLDWESDPNFQELLEAIIGQNWETQEFL